MTTEIELFTNTAGRKLAPLNSLLPRERRMIRNMAHAMGAALRVPKGRELVMHLGLGGERCNLEALENWVCRQTLDEDISMGDESLPWLMSKLEKELSGLEVDNG